VRSLIAILALSLTVGCGTLIPKKVELLQDKVRAFPEQRASEVELQRQAAAKAANLASCTALLARLTKADSNVVASAEDTAILSGAVSQSLGPPLRVSHDTATNLALDLQHAIARLNERIAEFKDDNNTNTGKKIEGTGLVQVSYFAWVGGFLALLFLGYLALKVVTILGSAANPGVALGVNVANLGARGLAKAFSQVLKGGQSFKKAIEEKLEDPALKAKVLEIFRAAQNEAQDDDVKAVIKSLKS
jgi:hypothetical protein